MPTDDLTLVKRVRSGDQRAFQLLVERYQRKVYAVALGMLKDKEEAMDVSQEAFVKVYKYLDHFKGDSSFYTWLYRITVNICIDVIRKRGRGRASRWSSTRRSAMDVSEANIGALGSPAGHQPPEERAAARAGGEDPGGPAAGAREAPRHPAAARGGGHVLRGPRPRPWRSPRAR